MSSNPFNPGAPASPANPFAPTQSTPAQHVNGVDTGALPPDTAAAALVDIDLDDPLLTSEKLTNTEGNAYATPAPPPSGKYVVKVKLEGVKSDGGKAALKLWPDKVAGEVVPYLPKTHTNKSGQVDQIYYCTGISVSIIDPKFPQFEGLQAYDSWVGTFADRNGVTKAETWLSRMKRPDGAPWIAKGERVKQGEVMDRLVKALAGEPSVIVELDWEWSCQGCGEAAKARHEKYPNSIVGMNKFPADPKVRGAYLNEMACKINVAHGYSKARLKIVDVQAL